MRFHAASPTLGDNRPSAAGRPAGPAAKRVGDLLLIAGKTPRLPDGERLLEIPLREQAIAEMENLEAIPRPSGSGLVHAVNAVYERDVRAPLTPRTAITSDLTTGLVEVDAVVWVAPHHADLVAS